MVNNRRHVLRRLAGPLAYLLSGVLLCMCGAVFGANEGIGGVASTVKGNLGAIAQLITAGSYIAGFAFGVASIVKFKAHKDNPTQVMISQPIVLLFVAAALIFIPSVFKTSGATLFGSGTTTNSTTGVSSF